MNLTTTNDPIEKAVDYFLNQRNCSQAILMTFGPELGFPIELAPKIAAPFGAGFGRLGQTCGATTGALMVLGLLAGNNVLQPLEQKELSYTLAREFMAEFSKRRGSTLCRELLGIDISAPEGLERVREEGLTETLCPELVREAAKILLEMIRKQGMS
jgi:C_GCAxxG_C_C family probable redox protein